jgi:hypothetical protein
MLFVSVEAIFLVEHGMCDGFTGTLGAFALLMAGLG